MICLFNSRIRLAVLATALVVSASHTMPAAFAGQNGLAATVNGRPITRSEVDEFVKYQIAQASATIRDPKKREEVISSLRKNALEGLIERELILAEYARLTNNQPIKPQYVDDDIKQFIRETYQGDQAKFLQELKAYGMTLKKFREVREKMLIVQMMRTHNAKDSGLITPDKKDAFLREHGELFREKDHIKLRSITIPKVGEDATSTPQDQKQLITEIRRRLIKNSADFESEAKTYSKDSHADAGGDWGWIDREKLSKRMADSVFALKGKSVSDVIEDEDNYYLFFVEARQEGKLKPREEIEQKLNEFLKMEERKKASDEWIKRLKAKATIKYF